ncbi:DUF6708 domain-containing protein [Pseudomonas mosselii]|uniref:DUF6708 domain-containing protein n=1 Tax=Pseudomonas mosselii TaxID=78327 RepID=UPI0030B8E053
MLRAQLQGHPVALDGFGGEQLQPGDVLYTADGKITHQGSHLVKTGIMLSIVEPGTNNVIDRFPLNNEYGEASIWAYVCTSWRRRASS